MAVFIEQRGQFFADHILSCSLILFVHVPWTYSICEQVKQNTLYTALKNIRQNAGIVVNFQPINALDGTLDFDFKDHNIRFVAEVRNEVRNHHLPQPG